MAGTTFGGVDFPKLPFELSCFWACGCPLACFLVSRQQVRTTLAAADAEAAAASGPRLPCRSFLNYVVDNDPVSHLLEPLLRVEKNGTHLRCLGSGRWVGGVGGWAGSRDVAVV